jgi:phosphonate transport system substrate-binding protein
VAETLVLGSVENDIRREVVSFELLSGYLAEKLADSGVTDVHTTVFRKEDAMAAALANGDVDLYFESPIVAAKVARASGATPLLHQFREGSASFCSLIVVPVNSPIETIQDLVNRKIAFEEVDSSSGFLMPAQMITQTGATLAKLRRRTRDVPKGKIGYAFTGDGNNTMYWLAQGWVDAGAISDLEFQHLETVFPGQFRVIAQGPMMPRQVVLKGTTLSKPVSDAVVTTFTTMHLDVKGRAALRAFHNTARFATFSNSRETFIPLYNILDQLTRDGLLTQSPDQQQKYLR